MAGLTGLEPAASGVTGRRYIQLNYNPITMKRTNFSQPKGSPTEIQVAEIIGGDILVSSFF
jgi:hypothetical protein